MGRIPDVILAVGEGICPDCHARLEPVEDRGRCPNGHGYWNVAKHPGGDWYFAWQIDHLAAESVRGSPSIDAMWPNQDQINSAYCRAESSNPGVTRWCGYGPRPAASMDPS
jgi:hypothetical protein